MIVGIFLYWVWVVLSLILTYIMLNCVYAYTDDGKKSDERCEYPAWCWLVLIVYPFIPVLNVVGFVFFCIMLSMSEQRKDIYLRGWFFDDVKRKE